MTENGSVNYTADMIKLGNASYNRNANAGVSFQSNSTSASNRTISGGVGHGLSIPYLLDGGASLDFSANESFLARNDRLTGQYRTLSHLGTAAWRPVSKGALSGGANATISDIRNVGGDEQLHYQAASLGVNAFNQSSANSTMTANASLQWTSNGTGQHSESVNANVRYTHARAFDVKGLRYDLVFNASKLQSRSTGIVVEQNSTASSSLDQSLDYRIGRANIRLALALARYGNASSKSIMLHLGRNFGSL